ARAVVPKAPLRQTEHGTVAGGEGWLVVNARDASWRTAERRGAHTDWEGDHRFDQLGMHLYVLQPSDPMGMYHWEADQEDFLVVAGQGLLVIEGEERPLEQWDFVHCPPSTQHVIVGAGDGPCVIVACGARVWETREGWGGYRVNEVAARHG